MPSDLNASIRYLEETNDPAAAFFNYTVDDTGEFGLIKANKEGLRLYAAELLKTSVKIEETPEAEGHPVFFAPSTWRCNGGYDFIAGILPEYHRRDEIAETIPEPAPPVAAPAGRRQPVLLFILMCIIGALMMLAT